MSKTLYVTLVVGADPEVQVDEKVWGKPKLRWRQDDDSAEFDFVSITGLPEDSFEITKLTNSKINVNDLMIKGEYPYTITVRYKDSDGDWKEASTDVTAPIQEGGKPVIRN